MEDVAQEEAQDKDISPRVDREEEVILNNHAAAGNEEKRRKKEERRKIQPGLDFAS